MGFSKLKIPKICEQCHKPFEAKTITTRFCSNLCASKNGKEQKKQEKERREKEKKLEENGIDTIQCENFISLKEATVLFGISKSTIHRLIKQKLIHSVNLGERLTRINKIELEKLFSPIIIDENDKQEKELPKKYKKEDCYTLSQVSEKFGANPSTVTSIIKKFNIPKEKIGKFVYVPKVEIDKIFIRQ